MRKSNIIFGITLFLSLACVQVLSQESKDKPSTPAKPTTDAKAAPDKKDEKPSPAEMQEWMTAANPGEHHKQLEPLVGKWKLTLKVPDGAGNWTTSSGQAEFKWVLGGRFLMEDVKAELGGQPFEWIGLHGYDNAKKKHIGTWADNFGTDFDDMEGTCSDGGKTITYVGDLEDHMGGTMKMKWIVKLADKDKPVFELFEVAKDGKETKQLEAVGSRAP